MKMTLSLVATFFLAFTLSAATRHDLSELKFMSGSWSDDSSDEFWTTPREGTMLGVGRTFGTGNSTFEFMRIGDTAEGIVYFASPHGNPPTPFPLKTLSGEKVIFENPSHDFPQRIIYWKKGSSLCGRTEGIIHGKEESEQWCWKRRT